MKKIIVLSFLICLFSFAKESFSNHLIYENSPYLQQHAHNPVNWYPWSKKAFNKAKKEHKLIFLSIGYSTCHWCHVMEKESFENKEIAKLLNRDFIAIKVDREERPDLDKYYQKIHQIITQRGGGWPLTIILTPNKKPIFAATYIPAYDRYGMQGLESLLPLIAKEYKKNPKKFEKIGDEIVALAKNLNNQTIPTKTINKTLIKKALNELYSQFDKQYGGFGVDVKFPREATLALLIDIYKLTQNKKALFMLTKTLDAMAQGGIYDQIEGGFFRYSTNKDFSIPHFEKMLYSNANLIAIYTKAYFLTNNPLYKKVALESIKAIEERFYYKGLYFSASDADTKGVEGGYFVYSYKEAFDALIKNGYSKEKAKKELSALGFSEDGNFKEELNNPILKRKVTPQTIAILQKLRTKREYPFIDKKQLTAWNAMYIKAKLLASKIDPSLKKEALHSLDTLVKKLYKNRILYHQILPHKEPTKRAFLEDYSYLIQALIEAYKESLEQKYLTLANRLFKEAKKEFYKNKKWYFSLKDEALVADIEDAAYPSAKAIMLFNELSLAALNEDLNLYLQAKKDIQNISAFVAKSPGYYPSATRATLRELYGDIIIKSNKQALQSLIKDELRLPYPYLIFLAKDIKEYQLCKIDRCFAKVKSEKKLLKTLKTRLPH